MSVSQSSSIPLILRGVAGGAGADPSCHWASGVVHPGQDANLSQNIDVFHGNSSNTLNYKCEPPGGARGKVRGSPK